MAITRRHLLKGAAAAAVSTGAGGWLFLHSERFGALPQGEALARLERSPHWSDEGFRNSLSTPRLAEGVDLWKLNLEFLLSGRPGTVPPLPLPAVRTVLNPVNLPQDVVIWLGHSSFFIRLGGKNILIDPVLSDHAAPVSFSTRAFPGTCLYRPEDFPDIDAVLISHDHWDHLDRDTMVTLHPRIDKIVCGLGTGEHLLRWGFAREHIHEGDWGDAVSLGGPIIRIVEARHYSGRSFSTCRSLWTGFVLETARVRLFYSGDSGYGPHFARIGRELGPFDLVLLECGQYDKRWPFIHMQPEETAQAAHDLYARALLPCHAGRFSISYHPWQEPYRRITAASRGRSFRLLTPKIGEPAAPWSGISPSSDWWKV